MRFSSSKVFAPLALAAVVGVAGLSPLPSPLVADVQAMSLPPQGPGIRILTIGGRAYVARAQLRVVIPGAAIEGQNPQPRMECTLSLSTLDEQAVSPLPARFSMWIRAGRQLRLVTLEPVANTTIWIGNSAQYVGTTRPIDQASPFLNEGPSANVQLQWREGRRIRFAEFPRVPIETLALP